MTAGADRPAPLVPSHVDCTDLDGFLLNTERFMASELVALASHEVIGAAVLLWARAWKQSPPASLPDNDKVIAAFARMPLARFRKLRSEILRGFVLCSDGRLYHLTLAQVAVHAYERKIAFRRKRETDAERLRQWRQSQRGNEHETPQHTRDETQSETRFVAEGGGGGGGRVRKREIPPSSDTPLDPAPDAPRSASPKARGCRLPPDWDPGPEGMAFAAAAGLVNGRAASELARFRDYWAAATGAAATKADWPATWRNWVRRAADSPQRGRPSPTAHEPPEPAWRREQRARNVAFLGPAASAEARAAVAGYALPATPFTEAPDAAPDLLG